MKKMAVRVCVTGTHTLIFHLVTAPRVPRAARENELASRFGGVEGKGVLDSTNLVLRAASHDVQQRGLARP